MSDTSWPDNRLTEMLGIAHPIIQAPMKGTSTPELAAAVSNAGGLGSLGCAGLDAPALRDTISDIRGRTDRPFNLNFFALGRVEPGAETIERACTLLAPFYAEKGLGEPLKWLDPLPAAFDETHLEVLLAAPPPVVSFHFGLPEAEAMSALRNAGIRVLSTATSVAEARGLAAAGVDAVIAQGWEAGGHRGAFTVEGDGIGVGVIALVPQIADAVSVPVIAAGGIADGRGIAAAFVLGASGVQIGTAFIRCAESAAPDAHRAAVAAGSDTSTRLSRAVSGRPARAHRNRYIDSMSAEAGELPHFPLMYSLAAPLVGSGDPDFGFFLYGQAAALSRDLPASDLVAVLATETFSILNLQGG